MHFTYQWSGCGARYPVAEDFRPHITIYDSLIMQFEWLGNTIHLQGLRDNDIRKFSLVNLKECKIQNQSLFFIVLH